MFMSLGPNSFIGAGMLIPIIEYAIMYAVQATAKLQRDRFKSMEIKARAVKDFDRYIDVSPGPSYALLLLSRSGSVSLT